jgi:hypothetical protein
MFHVEQISIQPNLDVVPIRDILQKLQFRDPKIQKFSTAAPFPPSSSAQVIPASKPFPISSLHPN